MIFFKVLVKITSVFIRRLGRLLRISSLWKLLPRVIHRYVKLVSVTCMMRFSLIVRVVILRRFFSRSEMSARVMIRLVLNLRRRL